MPEHHPIGKALAVLTGAAILAAALAVGVVIFVFGVVLFMVTVA